MRNGQRKTWRLRCAHVAAAALLVVVAPPPPAGAESQEAERRTEQAVKLIQERRYGEALEELDRAIAADPENWEAHYQRGRALGLQERMPEALASLLRATELNPGMAHAHELASIAAWGVGDRETAWDQIILAHLGGGDVIARVQAMAAETDPPADFLERISAPRVYVAALDLQEIDSRAEMPFNRNPLAREDQSRSGIPAEILGQERVREAWSDLLRVHREFREGLSRSPTYGVVLDPQLSEYVLRIAVDELGERPPREMEGYLELLVSATGASAYRRSIRFNQIDAGGEVRAEVARIVNDLEAWLRKIRDAPQ